MKQYSMLLAGLLILIYGTCNADTKRDLLCKKVAEQKVCFSERANPALFVPAYKDRKKWDALPDSIKIRLIKRGEAAAKSIWPTIKASDYLAFKWSGDRSSMEAPFNSRKQCLRDLVFAELAEGKGRFINNIVDGVWAICEQSSWVLSAHLPNQKRWSGLPDDEDVFIDLGAGEVGALVAWTYTLFSAEFDKISPLINRKIKSTVKERILVPYYSRDDMWWMAFAPDAFVNNWNIWVNYNVLQCIWLMEENAELRDSGIKKCMRSADKFINAYPADGGCDEGPSYWSHAGGKLYEFLAFTQGISNGRVNLFNEPIIKNISTYISKVNISYPYVVNFGDATAIISASPTLIFRCGIAVGDDNMKQYGSFLWSKMKDSYPESSFITAALDLFDRESIGSYENKEVFNSYFWFPDLQLGGGRDREGQNRGFYFAALGAHNGQSHNHNDVGSFVLFYDGKPLLVDVGVGTYTRQTFSADRYSIWNMQSSYHNLPEINGCQQQAGSKYKAAEVSFTNSLKRVSMSMRLDRAYHDTCGVTKWERSLTLNRGKEFIVSDDFVLSTSKGETILNLMTPCEVELKDGKVVLSSEAGKFEIAYLPVVTKVEVEKVTCTDPRILKVWVNGINRVRLTLKSNIMKGVSTLTVKKQSKVLK